jgi:hypothetical protein
MPKPLLVLCLLAVALSCQPEGGSQDAEPIVADVLAQVEAASLPVVEMPLEPRRRASTFVPASPDTRSQAQIDEAACWAADSSLPIEQRWRCAPSLRPKTLKGLASTPVIPNSWTVPNWFVNKSTGSDQNTCTSSGSPCATKQEIWVHRWGMNGSQSGMCPRFQQTTTLEQDASDTDNSDPLYLCAVMEKGASFILKGGTPSSTAAVFTRSAAKNTGVGTNSLLAGSFSAGAPAANMLVTNTTRGNSRAWIYKTAGGSNWNLSQPLTPVTVPTTSLPTEVDTWVSTDNVTLSSPIAINVVSASGIVGDGNTSNSAVYLYNMTVFDPTGSSFDNSITIGGNVEIVESMLQRDALYMAGSNTAISLGSGDFVINSDGLASFSDSIPPGQTDYFGGIVGAFTAASFCAFDEDVILAGNITCNSGTFFGGADLGHAFFDGTLTQRSGIIIAFSNSVLYGSSTNTINLLGSSHFDNASGSNFQTIFTAPGLVTGIQLNGVASGTSLCTTTLNAGISTTPAHLDAACGAAGFGSAAYRWGGASVANF